MTRINATLDPKRLIDQHLRAELRELPRIFTMIKNRMESNNPIIEDEIPLAFQMGIGHVKFFYNKPKYLLHRFILLQNEYLNRFKKEWKGGKYIKEYVEYIKNNTNLWKGWKCDIIEGESVYTIATHILINRITERIFNMKTRPFYYGKPISKTKAINILNGNYGKKKISGKS